MTLLDSPETAALTMGLLFFVTFVLTHTRANHPYAMPKQLAHICAVFGVLPVAFLGTSLTIAWLRPELYPVPWNTLLAWYLVATLVIALMVAVTYFRVWNLPRYKTPAKSL